ncbi:MAG: glycosyltransferase family 9 protein [Advenella sp.]|uniref:Glycosyltransferase n=1 Tax=Advenella kashmirensis TaxID=310575 RepID=A0A356LJL0_9BURK|nr:glycosyltransferase family 9 protein [Advenella sp. FME57]HBP31213.1 glycosyltransferase [Advenella kashmirensis]
MIPSEHIALLVSNKLGDALLLLPLAHNLVRSGHRVTVFGRQAHALASWLPGLEVRPLPSEGVLALTQFDSLFQMDIDQPIVLDPHNCPRPLNSLTLWLRQQPAQPRLFLDELRHFARAVYGIEDWSSACGLVTQHPERWGRNRRRIVIHPTAGSAERYWSDSKFIELARRLCCDGHDVAFVVEEREAAAWQAAAQGQPFTVNHFASLQALGDFIHESGYLIGNDSGIGHLASALGVPTVTISHRPRNMLRWRPQWAPGVIVPHLWLPLRAWRRKYWRYAVTVAAVTRSLRQLQQMEARNDRSTVPAAPELVEAVATDIPPA